MPTQMGPCWDLPHPRQAAMISNPEPCPPDVPQGGGSGSYPPHPPRLIREGVGATLELSQHRGPEQRSQAPALPGPLTLHQPEALPSQGKQGWGRGPPAGSTETHGKGIFPRLFLNPQPALLLTCPSYPTPRSPSNSGRALCSHSQHVRTRMSPTCSQTP